MDIVLPLVYLFVGALIGAAIASLWLKAKQQGGDEARGAMGAQLQARIDEVAKLEQGVGELRHELADKQSALEQSRAETVRLETQLSEERRQGAEKLKLLEEARQQLNIEFQNLANKILEEKSQKFTEQNKTNLDQLLKPLREQLGDFRKKVEDTYDKESKDRVSLMHEIKSLKQLNQQISDDAINLTNALKGQSQTQGAWGEVVLERVLEESGLHKGREYETQESFTTDEGKRYRPDVIVHLPEGKDIVVDSKVTLTAYERYCAASNDEERAKALKEHVQSLRTHIKGLSEKRYEDLPGVKSLDFVLLFVPIEAAFITAVEADQAIFRDAFDKNIIVVSPTTLLATLKTVHNIWRYEHQNQNAQEIAAKAGGLYDQFVLFVEALDDVGDKLNKAQQAFDKSRARLVSGRGNLVRRSEELQKLGAKNKKQLAAQILESVSDASVDNE